MKDQVVYVPVTFFYASFDVHGVFTSKARALTALKKQAPNMDKDTQSTVLEIPLNKAGDYFN
jgi:hypothetical protein